MKLLLICLLHLIILFIGAVSPATAQFDIWDLDCSNYYGNYTSNSTYKSNLDALLTKITTLDVGFYNFSAGQDPDQVYALAMCRGDVSVTECHSCLSFLKSNLTGSCPTDRGVTGWAEKCMIRYDATPSIFGTWANKPLKNLYTEVGVGGNVDHFQDVVEELLMSLPNKTADGDARLKFATGEANVNASLTVFGLMQCTPDLLASDCLGCLYWNMYYVLYDARGQTGVRVFTPSCSIRYELNKFYEGSSTGSGKGVNPKIVIISVLAVLLLAILILFGILIWLFLTRRQKEKMRKKAIHFKSLEMDFKIIKRATRNFSKQLGSSGKSRVYKGKLDGSEIAVKRITDTSSDGKDFKNGVMTTTKLQHTNLAEVLGFCVEGNERLIIFEYVSRGSLDQILFDPKYAKERTHLDWKKRYAIIGGIAEGLLYLHEKYRCKILHGDLKAANVLLDEEWRPKITDIGTSKLFQENKNQTHVVTQAEATVLIPENQTQEITREKGTNAYMAPEYLNDGIISDKTDVYSYGVLVLEILAGRRSIIHDQEDLITLARRTLNHGRVLEFIDPKIKPTTDSAKECIEIALLCLHENAKERAEMYSVVERLTKLDQPSTPESIQFSSPQPLLPNRFPSSSS